MYRKFLLKRVLYAGLMYVVMLFTFSVLFNGVTEQTMRSQILEEVNASMSKYRNLEADQLSRLREQRLQELFSRYHLDRPVWERILWQTVNSLTFQFGNSTIIRSAAGEREVLAIIGEVLPRTLILFTTEVILVVFLGVGLGLICARKPNGTLDRLVSMVTMITNGMPSWWFGLIMIMIFSYALPWFPSGGFQSNPAPEGWAGTLDFLHHLALPLLTLTILGIWGTAYLTRNIVLGNLQEDFIMAARARGIPERRVLFGHTLRTSMPAIITFAVLTLFSSISGNIIVEGIFSWPGLGNLYFVAVQQNDVPVLMAALTIGTLVNMIGFVLLDALYGFLDPRIKVGGKA